jgi:hypothetical protein
MKLCFDIHFQIRLDDGLKRKYYAAAGSIFQNNVVVINPDDSPAKVSLIIYRDAGFNPRLTPGKPFIVGQFVKPTLQPR